MVVGADEFFQNLYVGLVEGLMKPERFEKMQRDLLFFCPSQKRAEHFFRRLAPEFTLCPVAGSVVGGLEMVEEFGDGGCGDFWRGIELGFLGNNTPDTARFAVAAGITKGVLSVAFDWVIPITDIGRPARTEAEVDWDEGEVGGEDEVELILFGKVGRFFIPVVELDAVGWLVANLDEATLHFLGPEVVGDEVLSTDSGVGLHASGSGMLARIIGIGGVEGGGEDGVRSDVVSVWVEGDPPGVRIWVGSEGGESFCGRVVEEPGGVFGADRAVSSFGLGVVEDGFAEEKVSSGSPGEIVEGVVRILAPEAGKDDFTVVHFTVAVGISEMGEVGFFGAENTTVSIKDKREGDVKVIGPSRAFVGFAILIGVLENDNFIAGFLAGINMRVGDGGGDPKTAMFIPAHLDGAGHLGEIFFGGKAIDLETWIDFEGLQFFGRGKKLVGSA